MKILTPTDTAEQAIQSVYDYVQSHPLCYIISTFGCQMNEHDSEKMSGLMETMGLDAAHSEEDADIVLFNTCAVRENAELRIFGNIGRIKAIKEKKPDLILGVCGCMMQQAHMVEAIQKKYPYVDLVFGTHNFNQLPVFLARLLQKRTRVIEIMEDADLVEGLPVKRNLDVKAFVNIMQGCDNFCTYCIVPYTRGREKSRLPSDILAEIETLVGQGVKEVTLLGQNVNSYGKGLQGQDFAELLRQVSAVDGLERIRFMTSHPKDLSERLIHAMQLPKVMPSIHLPAQSGSNRILKAMNRKYTREDYLEKVAQLRRHIPDLAITTDLIIGFPGETEQDVEETIDLIKTVRFDAAFTFIYSKRTGTPAAAMPDDSDDKLKHERFNRMLAVLNDIVIEKNSARLGQVFEVLVEGATEEGTDYQGRTRENFLITFPADPAMAGTLQQVRVTRSKKFSLQGEIL